MVQLKSQNLVKVSMAPILSGPSYVYVVTPNLFTIIKLFTILR